MAGLAPLLYNYKEVLTVADLLSKAAANGDAVKEVASIGVAATAVDTGMVAVAVPAFLGTMGLAAYAYLSDTKYYENKRLIPCGITASPVMSHDLRAMPSPGILTVRLGMHPLHEHKFVTAIDQPPLGTTVESWLDQMADAIRLASQIADKQAEIIHHTENGDAHLARRAEQELSALQSAAETVANTSPIQGYRLRAMASAGGEGDSSGASDATRQSERAYHDALAHALMLPDSPMRATMLTGFAGEFAAGRRWDLFQVAVQNALEAANSVPEKERSSALKRDLFAEMGLSMPEDPREMPPPTVRQYLASVTTSEMGAAKRDAQYMKLVVNLQETLNGWNRVMLAAGSLSVNALAALSTEKTPLPVDLVWQQSAAEAVGLITIGDKAKPMAEWIGWRQNLRTIRRVTGVLIAGGIGVWDVGNIAQAWWEAMRNPTIYGIIDRALMWTGGSLVIGVIGCIIAVLRAEKPKDIWGSDFKRAKENPTSIEEFPEMMDVWYQTLINVNGEKNEFGNGMWSLSRRALVKASVKTVNGKQYNLVALMKMDRFWKPAQKNVYSADLLHAIEQQGRVWSPQELTQIRMLHIKWRQYSVGNPQFADTVEWLAAHGNESVVRWVYKEALHGVPKAQEVFKQLVATDNPLAIRLLSYANDGGNVVIKYRK